MLINNIYKVNDPITVVLPIDIDTSTISLYSYVDGTTLNTESFTITNISNFNFINFDATSFDSTMIIKYDNRAEFIRVGKPPVYLLLHYIPYKNEEVNYSQYDYNANILNTGAMTDLGNNIYVAHNITTIKSYYVVANGIVTFTLPDKYNIGGSTGNSIVLERGNWQLIALPVEGDVATNFVDKLAQQENMLDTDLIEICSAYPGHINKFLSYIPGFTDRTSEHNFLLTYSDEDVKEITAFWVKCKNWAHRTDDIKFSW